MLIEFSVQNFRSILERQTLSLVATKDKTFQDTHVIETGNAAVPRALRGTGLYGANGSGKTNLLRALEYFQFLVKQSFTFVPDSGTNLAPFALQENAQASVAEFEITVLIDKVRYQYGFRLDRQKIHEEWLIVYRSQRGPGQSWFERRLDPVTGKYDFQFSEKLAGAKKLWQDATRPNALFLSTAVQLNSEMLHPLFDWIANRPIFFNPLPMSADYTISRLEDPKFHQQVVDFLQGSDIPVAEILVETTRGTGPHFRFDATTGKAESTVEEFVHKRARFRHVTNNGEALFDLLEESMGTQRLFALTGPVLDILEKGRLLIVDEIESSLHPLLVRRLLDLFHNPAINKNGAQIVFSTHSTLLFDQSIFRRDQIWLVEKDLRQASRLVPLSDFQLRKDLVLGNAYLDGRFGAIPIFPAIKEI
jgi:AAA15 family ATPase/GTPase